jgi:DNA/RNA-binding domain of Phe-tRNA-synthetase-like protein
LLASRDISLRLSRQLGGTRTRRYWRQSDRAKSTPETRRALLTIEGVNGVTLAEIEAAIEELVSLVQEYCGGEISWSLVDRDDPWAVME